VCRKFGAHSLKEEEKDLCAWVHDAFDYVIDCRLVCTCVFVCGGDDVTTTLLHCYAMISIFIAELSIRRLFCI